MPIVETKILKFTTKEISLSYTDLVAILGVYGITIPDGAPLQITYQSKSKAVEADGMSDGDNVTFRYTVLELS